MFDWITNSSQSFNITYQSPFERAGFFSRLSFSWMMPFVNSVNRSKDEQISIDDIPDVGPTESSDYFENLFNQAYISEKKKNLNVKPRLFFPLLFKLKKNLSYTILMQCGFIGFRLACIYFFSRILSTIEEYDYGYTDSPLLWGLGMIITIIGTVTFHEHSFYISTKSIIELKTGVILLLYKKITRVSLWSLQKISIGKIVNIAANEVNCFDVGLYHICILLVAPFLFFAAGLILWNFYGPIGLVGLGYNIMLVPVFFLITRLTKKSRELKNLATDDRNKMTNEAIDAIRLLKMYGWDMQFGTFIERIRKKEIGIISTIISSDFFKYALAQSSHAISSFLTFFCYTAAGNSLSVSVVYPTLVLMGLLRVIGCYYITTGFSLLLNGNLFFERVVEILEIPEVNQEKLKPPIDDNNAIEFKDFSAYWTENTSKSSSDDKDFPLHDIEKPTISNITTEIKKNSLTVVVGSIGSGKSTFLMTLTGEIPRYTGSILCQGTIAHVEQEPIIFSGTVRENILFGKAYDKTLYEKVLDGCCLRSDLDQLPNSDKTEIGEKGVNLSGGQKARISLARAIYSNSDIILLDDPLSAVDAIVAKKLYEVAILGLLKNKTVILATHKVDLIKNEKHIIVFDQGKIIGEGNNEQLLSLNIEIDKIYKETQEKHKTMISQSQPGNHLVHNHYEAEEENVKNLEEGSLFSKEDEREGKVSQTIYREYMKSTFTFFTFVIFLFIVVMAEVINAAYYRLVGYWTSGTLDNQVSSIICGSLAGGLLVFIVFRAIFFVGQALNGTHKLHNSMLFSILRSPVEFYDKNPVGRVLNRFSNDMGVIDQLLLMTYYEVFVGLFALLSMFIFVWVVSPILLIPSVIGFICYFFSMKWMIKSIQNTKMLELSTRSPIYSDFHMTLTGLVTIRAYDQSSNFIERFITNLNANAKAGYYYLSTTSYMGFQLDICSSIYIINALIIIISMEDLNLTLCGFAISFLLNIAEFLEWILRQGIVCNMFMASWARIYSYTKLPSEAPLIQPGDRDLKEKKWPSTGTIEFDHVYFKYRKNLDHVIKDMSFKINSGEKIGCVGRTGAGKSSILQMLFRTFEIDRSKKYSSSKIKIDGIDIADVGLELLRSSISIIPQTPILFSGTIRRNLDPLERYNTVELWNSLKEAGLAKFVEGLKDGLDTDMTNATSVFSVGQKQLLCLARAILKQNKIIVLDEATANVDFETELIIQKKIKEKFKDCTVLTIAHRLSTIANYDKILVLDNGRCIEFDEPYKLLVNQIGDNQITNNTGVFATMVLNSGPSTSDFILKTSKESYFAKRNSVSPLKS